MTLDNKGQYLKYLSAILFIDVIIVPLVDGFVLVVLVVVVSVFVAADVLFHFHVSFMIAVASVGCLLCLPLQLTITLCHGLDFKFSLDLIFVVISFIRYSVDCFAVFYLVYYLCIPCQIQLYICRILLLLSCHLICDLASRL